MKQPENTFTTVSDALTIYVVDDEKIISETLTIILRNRGFCAHGYTAPADVLNRCSQAPPDLLLSDVSMPSMSGPELAKAIRKLCPNCIVIFFSGEPLLLTAIADQLLVDQPFACLNKPIHPETLLQTISFLTALKPVSASGVQVVVKS